jgi:REP element-mobilizing transposase RayT
LERRLAPIDDAAADAGSAAAQRLWSASYFAGSVAGAPISVLRQYIEQQNRPA